MLNNKAIWICSLECLDGSQAGNKKISGFLLMRFLIANPLSLSDFTLCDVMWIMPLTNPLT